MSALRQLAPEPAGRPSFLASFGAVFTGQLARARVAAIPIFMAATLQSVGLVVLLKGLVEKVEDLEKRVPAPKPAKAPAKPEAASKPASKKPAASPAKRKR